MQNKAKRFCLWMVFLFVSNFTIVLLYQPLLHWSKWKWGPFMAFYIVVSLIAIALLLIFRIVNSRHDKKQFQTSLGITVGFLVYVLVLMFLPSHSPEVKYEGCWTGSNAAGHIELYEDGLFEIQWTGLLRGGTYHGDWQERKDTIYLNYDGRDLDRVGTLLFKSSDRLTPVDGVNGLFLKEVDFVRGDCPSWN